MLSAHAAWTKASWRTAKSCGPDPPTLGSSLRVTSSQITVANKPGTPRRPRISRKPSRRECRLIWLPCCCLRAQVHFLCTQGTRVRPAPGIPCALSDFEGDDWRKTRTHSRRGNVKVCPMSSLRAKRRVRRRLKERRRKQSTLSPRRRPGLLRRFHLHAHALRRTP